MYATRAIRVLRILSVVCLLGLLSVLPSVARAQQPVRYTVRVTAPEHHTLQVEAVFPGLPSEPLRVRMSRTSPGRYALHEFAKNVWDVTAADGAGRPLQVDRSDPSEWGIAGHDGTVKVTYRVFGDSVDGTYLAVDTTHAHLNMPATLMWAVGLERRSAEVRFVPPPGSGWRVASQLYPTGDPLVFTAPNLQYLMDSPTMVSDFALRTFQVTDPTGRTAEYRIAMHHLGTDAQLDEYTAGAKRIVEEQIAVFGEQPDFDAGTYTFLVDYLPWSGGDGMEHRNSTIVSSSGSLDRGPLQMLGTVSHEFFHSWNVERIRPVGIEPFDFTDANITDGLWLAEGFTSYYGALALVRAGINDLHQMTGSAAGWVNVVLNTPARRYRSAIDMSRQAAFVDGARWVDPTNQPVLFVSYYTWGAAIALNLDLSLRQHSGGKVTLDDFMRAMWAKHGKPGGPSPAIIVHPYTMRDVRDRIAEVSGDEAFADDFFTKYITGREAPDYAGLLLQAGLVLERRDPGKAWIGRPPMRAASGGGLQVLAPVGEDTPLYGAGIDQGDVILSLDEVALRSFGDITAVLDAHAPGDVVTARVMRRGASAPVTLEVRLIEQTALTISTLEEKGQTPSAAQSAFREAWLGSRVGRH